MIVRAHRCTLYYVYRVAKAYHSPCRNPNPARITECIDRWELSAIARTARTSYRVSDRKTALCTPQESTGPGTAVQCCRIWPLYFPTSRCLRSPRRRGQGLTCGRAPAPRARTGFSGFTAPLSRHRVSHNTHPLRASASPHAGRDRTSTTETNMPNTKRQARTTTFCTAQLRTPWRVEIPIQSHTPCSTI